MILSDKTIKERIKKEEIIIDPINLDNIQPSSVDLHLGNKFLVFHNYAYEILDVKQKINNTNMIEVEEGGFFIMHPHEFVLGNTGEYVEIPDDLVGRLDGRSSIGRLGLIIHATAGFIDPGFKGNITLEMLNVSNIPIKIYPGMRIAQISYEALSTPAEKPYGSANGRSKYNGQTDPTPSQIWKDFIGK